MKIKIRMMITKLICRRQVRADMILYDDQDQDQDDQDDDAKVDL